MTWDTRVTRCEPQILQPKNEPGDTHGMSETVSWNGAWQRLWDLVTTKMCTGLVRSSYLPPKGDQVLEGWPGLFEIQLLFLKLFIVRVTPDPHGNLEVTEKLEEHNHPYVCNSAITTFTILVFILLFVHTNHNIYLFYIWTVLAFWAPYGYFFSMFLEKFLLWKSMHNTKFSILTTQLCSED